MARGVPGNVSGPGDFVEPDKLFLCFIFPPDFWKFFATLKFDSQSRVAKHPKINTNNSIYRAIINLINYQ